MEKARNQYLASRGICLRHLGIGIISPRILTRMAQRILYCRKVELSLGGHGGRRAPFQEQGRNGGLPECQRRGFPLSYGEKSGFLGNILRRRHGRFAQIDQIGDSRPKLGGAALSI